MISHTERNRCQDNIGPFNPYYRGHKYASYTGEQGTSHKKQIMSKKQKKKSHDKLIIENTMKPKTKHRKKYQARMH